MCLVVCLLFALPGCGRSESYNICSFCGEQILESARFCSQCGEEVYEADKSVDYSVLDLGDCNANVSWEIRSNGTLYVYGRGTIPNYEGYESDGEIAPWRASAVCSEIKDVLIGDGITGIGENAFNDLSLESINFGHSVITYEHICNAYYAKTAYIPATMKDIMPFLYDANSSYVSVNIEIYYEGSHEEWLSKTEKRYLNEHNNIVIHYDCEY